MNESWTAPDLDEAQLNRIKEIITELEGIWNQPVRFTTRAEIDSLTQEQAELVRIATRRMLVMQLLHQELHMHELDDCGDYLTAATENWAALFGMLWSDDFQDELPITKKFLLDFNEFPQGGSDGEVRYDLLSEELFDELQNEADANR
jgi:hypothetical protein